MITILSMKMTIFINWNQIYCIVILYQINTLKRFTKQIFKTHIREFITMITLEQITRVFSNTNERISSPVRMRNEN